MIHSVRRLFFLLCFATLSAGATSAHAEGGCPPGQYPQQGQGWQTCVPIPGAGQNQAPAPIPQRWLDKWQAIATDTQKGSLGTAVDVDTADRAESAAMNDCHAKGGDHCEVQISLRNGCVSLVIGNTLMNTKGAPTQVEADRRALSKCQEEDKSCRVLYSACSLPVRVQ